MKSIFTTSRLLSLVLALCLLPLMPDIMALQLTDLEIFCGSRAPWGINQHVKIDNSGHLEYFEFDIASNSKSSVSTMSLSTVQLEALYSKANSEGFFALNSIYDSGALDGSGISIYIKADNGDEKLVEDYNFPVPAINEIVKLLNTYLQSSGLPQLSYGSL